MKSITIGIIIIAIALGMFIEYSFKIGMPHQTIKSVTIKDSVIVHKTDTVTRVLYKESIKRVVTKDTLWHKDSSKIDSVSIFNMDTTFFDTTKIDSTVFIDSATVKLNIIAALVVPPVKVGLIYIPPASHVRTKTITYVEYKTDWKKTAEIGVVTGVVVVGGIILLKSILTK